MANKHLSEDKIQYTIDIKTAKAQQEIHKLEKQTAQLRTENKQRLNQMIKLEAAGKKETEGYKKALKLAGFLTRDPRMKERKKYGLKKARKASQFSKR